MQEENDIDQLFRNGLDDPGIPFNEMDWEHMERKLDAKEKKRVIPIWLFTAGSIAAALVIGMLWVFMKSQVTVQKSVIRTAATQTSPTQTSANKASANNASENKHAAEKTGSAQSIVSGRVPSRQILPVDSFSEDFVARNITSVLVRTASGGASEINPHNLLQPQQHNLQARTSYLVRPDAIKDGLVAQGITVKPSVPNTPMAVETDSSVLARKADALARSVDPLHKPAHTDIARTVKKNMDNALDRKPDLILSAMAAPDISTTKSSKPSKLSSNFGVLATYALTHKISFTSGAVYAKKIYNSGGITPGGYDNAGAEWEVKANCDVIDIPVNINYKVLNMKKMSVSINTGLSSYFMLKERYEFINGQVGGQQQVSNLEITNQNRHLLGIANVSVTLDHKISESVSIGVQPFAKIPLTGIGNGNVNLKSAGMSFSLNIGLFPAKKPGKYAVLYP